MECTFRFQTRKSSKVQWESTFLQVAEEREGGFKRDARRPDSLTVTGLVDLLTAYVKIVVVIYALRDVTVQGEG